MEVLTVTNVWKICFVSVCKHGRNLNETIDNINTTSTIKSETLYPRAIMTSSADSLPSSSTSKFFCV